LLRACIDIGSNTTRLLVAECEQGRISEFHQERAFTRIGAAIDEDGMIAAEKVAEIAAVVAAQLTAAQRLGVDAVRCVATASVRRAANAAVLAEQIAQRCQGLVVEVLSGEEEARLAFLGASATSNAPAGANLGVVDVGGGSSELVVGVRPAQISWWASYHLGSGDLTAACLPSDPPEPPELAAAREHIAAVLRDAEPPPVETALAVGGSATSLVRLAGRRLDADSLGRSLRLLCSLPAASVAAEFGLDHQRVRLLPAGLLILEAAAERLRVPLRVARGGLREGVLLEAAGSAGPGVE